MQATALTCIGPGHWQEGKEVEIYLVLCLYSKCMLGIVKTNK